MIDNNDDNNLIDEEYQISSGQMPDESQSFGSDYACNSQGGSNDAQVGAAQTWPRILQRQGRAASSLI